MSTTAQSRQFRRKPLAQDHVRSCSGPAGTKQRMVLWTELTKQRALLLANAHVLSIADREPETHADPVDQASTEFEQDLAIQTRIRTFDQLRSIERALQLLRTNGYGRCHRCHEEIPYNRLIVKPDTLFCVPCLTLIEHGAARN